MLTIKELTKEQIIKIIKKAIKIKNSKFSKLTNRKSIANIFIEPSTRTKISFEKAQKDLGMEIYNINNNDSSLKKSESLYDTITTLKCYGIKNFVIRSSINEYWKSLNSVKNINIINAGDGNKNHPTQALLDAMTIYEQFHQLDNLKILICGDVMNSRVFHSFQELISKFNSELLISAPVKLQDNNFKDQYVDFNETLPNVDVVMMLRIQFERHIEKFKIDDYNKNFGINNNNINKLKKNAILMHPGPVNRGIEIANDIDYTNDQIKILEQVKNGLYIRKVILGRL